MNNTSKNIVSIIYEDGSEYIGNVVDGKPDGKGKMIFPNHDLYEGEWKSGVMQGHGEYNRFNSEKDKYVETYIGDFSQGQLHGIGRMQYSNHTVYDGQWQNGKRTGIGTLWVSPTEYFHGLWKYDQFIRGVQRFNNGDWYDGTFQNGKFQGFGKYFYSTGMMLDGEFAEGKMQKGLAVMLDGTIKTIG